MVNLKPAFSFIFRRRYGFHLLIWLMYALFSLIDMQSYVIKRGWLFLVMPFLISFSLMAVLVYGNTQFLVPRLLERKRHFLYALGVIILVAINTLLRSRMQQYFDALVWPEDLMAITSYFKWNIFYALLFIMISTLLFYAQRWAEEREQVRNIQISQLETELKYLRAQLNPHFLFNGLNTIYGTIDLSNNQARNMVVQFSDLLRYNLYEADTDRVDLQQEVSYLQNYVALQRARSDASLSIDLQIDISNGNRPVAPLLFVAFIENAFKYTTRDPQQTNRILITLKEAAGKLTFTCRNAYDIQPGAPGIGLANVRRRLELLYPGRHTLDIQQSDNTYSVTLTLDL
ncbi:MAG: histidine kinase [Bacteroidetes bacterium]|nr:histidine kinase [Bacteroidota bacterium]